MPKPTSLRFVYDLHECLYYWHCNTEIKIHFFFQKGKQAYAASQDRKRKLANSIKEINGNATNGAAVANGKSKCLSNGHANGHSNGYSNGYSNGVTKKSQ